MTRSKNDLKNKSVWDCMDKNNNSSSNDDDDDDTTGSSSKSSSSPRDSSSSNSSSSSSKSMKSGEKYQGQKEGIQDPPPKISGKEHDLNNDQVETTIMKSSSSSTNSNTETFTTNPTDASSLGEKEEKSEDIKVTNNDSSSEDIQQEKETSTNNNDDNSKSLLKSVEESKGGECVEVVLKKDDNNYEKKMEVEKELPQKKEDGENIVITNNNNNNNKTKKKEETQDDDDDDDEERQQQQEEEEDASDEYEMIEIISSSLLRKGHGPCCNVLDDDEDDGPCPNKAAVVYANKASVDERWNYCLDCQDADYGGWPDINEMPVKFIADAHLDLMKEKCSRQPDPSMPVGLMKPPPTATTIKAAAAAATTTTVASPLPGRNKMTNNPEKQKGLLVTPLPDTIMAASGKKNEVVVAMARLGNDSSMSSTATVTGKGKAGKASGATGTKKKKEQMSKETQAAMKKWRANADKLGGKGLPLRLKPDHSTKEAIFNSLKDTFRPHSMTEIHNDLMKGTVPGPVLLSCLGTMSMGDNKNPFADDDNDDDDDESEDEANGKGDGTDKKKHGTNSKKEKGERKKIGKNDDETPKDPFKSSLIFKAGTNNKKGNNGVYYVDYKLLPELSRDERDDLMNKSAQADNEKVALQTRLKKIREETKRLNSEPKNDELEKLLAQDESTVEKLEEQVNEARQYLKNEKDAQRTKHKIQLMTAQWRKRKALCHEFLTVMEELTDGTITRKKALNGDGSLALDSDEQAVKSTMELHRNKRQKIALKGKAIGHKSAVGGKSDDSLSNPNFVAVILNSQHKAERVYLDEETG